MQGAASGPCVAPDSGVLSRIIAFFSEGCFKEAAEMAQALTVKYPQHSFGWKALGLALKKTGHPDALAVMRKAVELAPGDADAHNNLGMVFKTSLVAVTKTSYST